MRIARTAIVGVTLTAACAGGDRTVAIETAPFGWDHAVTPFNVAAPVGEPLGDAAQPIAGHTLREIVVDPDVRVRADGRACGACHAWAPTMTRQDFCDVRVPAFLALPTSTGAPDDPPDAKPQSLKDVFARWRARGCPD